MVEGLEIRIEFLRLTLQLKYQERDLCHNIQNVTNL